MSRTADLPNVNFPKYQTTLTSIIKMDYMANWGEPILWSSGKSSGLRQNDFRLFRSH